MDINYKQIKYVAFVNEFEKIAINLSEIGAGIKHEFNPKFFGSKVQEFNPAAHAISSLPSGGFGAKPTRFAFKPIELASKQYVATPMPTISNPVLASRQYAAFKEAHKIMGVLKR